MGVPMLDFVNCLASKPGSKEVLRVHVTREDAEGFPVTQAPGEFSANEQVFENYGQPNHNYFLYHGFTVLDNPHDCLLWQVPQSRTTECLTLARVTDGAFARSLALHTNASLQGSDLNVLECHGRGVLLSSLRSSLAEVPTALVAATEASSGKLAAARAKEAVAFAEVEQHLRLQSIEHLEILRAQAQCVDLEEVEACQGDVRDDSDSAICKRGEQRRK